MAEVALRARIDAVGTNPCLDEVEIDLHDPPLAPDVFDQEGEPGFDPLPGIAAALPQEGVLRGLLADRRTPADAAARGISFHRIFNRLEVEAVMRTELAVLRCDCSTNHVAIHSADRQPI